ncbi:hypothetical protein J6590_062096 [Homalodisca vitripennis]|nr:hypothetical protein J6590_062096 [Homalodisca vitripennis]
MNSHLTESACNIRHLYTYHVSLIRGGVSKCQDGRLSTITPPLLLEFSFTLSYIHKKVRYEYLVSPGGVRAKKYCLNLGTKKRTACKHRSAQRPPIILREPPYP